MRVEVEQLSKRYGESFALEIPALSIETGATFGLVGNNGAGKTTFLRLLLDLLQADTGSIRIHEWVVSQSDEWKSHIGSYLDESFLLDYLTPLEFFSFIGSLYGLSKTQTIERVEPYRDFLPADSLNHSSKYIRDLSKGNAKKVGIVGALFVEPEIIILDEPFANLDPRSQISLKSILQKINSIKGSTLLISSHDLAHVTDICERIAVLEEGHLAQEIQTSEATLSELETYFATQ
ncbi:MAG: ABC transporter ATP-binding protein [Rhodothermales bacterium]